MNPYQIYNLLTLLITFSFSLALAYMIIVSKNRNRERKANIILTALEKGQTIDPEMLKSSAGEKKTRNKYILLALLCLGCASSLFAVLAIIVSIADMCIRGEYYSDPIMPCIIFTVIGASLLIAYFQGKKMLRPELKQEEQNKQ